MLLLCCVTPTECPRPTLDEGTLEFGKTPSSIFNLIITLLHRHDRKCYHMITFSVVANTIHSLLLSTFTIFQYDPFLPVGPARLTFGEQNECTTNPHRQLPSTAPLSSDGVCKSRAIALGTRSVERGRPIDGCDYFYCFTGFDSERGNASACGHE